MNLIIVESPTKARTLSKFLGSDYSIEATMGHIKDLPKSTLGIDVEKNFKPQYDDIQKKSDVVSVILKAAKKAGKIYLATDPDREGEAIAKHVEEVINTNLKHSAKNSKLGRIVFHEITKEAVEEAIKNPKSIDENMVDAQIARRVLDRLVGYKLSPLLWRKVRRGLSAGRVQSVTVRLIVEKEKEIEKFKSQEYWEIFAEVIKRNKSKSENKSFVVQLIRIGEKKADIANEKDAREIVGNLEKSTYDVFDVQKKEVRRNPYPPFTTSTMTQAAARIMFWSAKKTMSIAQALYEEGLITYHRTDSTNIATSAIEKVRNYIKTEYGIKYLPEKPIFYKTQSKVAQEAHEAIRPTKLDSKFEVSNRKFAKDAQSLYNLIWKKFVACQMNPSLYDETTIDVSAKLKTKPINYLLRASGQIMLFDGWKILYKREEESLRLPEVVKGEGLDLISSKSEETKGKKVWGDQKFTQAPARYSEASLIKTLEKLGIGRPSTYAPIISTIQIRNYVVKEEGRFSPTSIGIAVNDFLMDNFPDVFEYSFTAKMEDDLDNIAKGEVKWTGVIGDFWKPFDKKLISVGKNSKRVKIAVEKLGKKCPECKEGELVIRIGRFGKFISCSRFPDCKYTEKYVEKIGKKCPDCKKGDVIVKRSQKGRKFFGCSRYPECKWASWRKPGEEEKKEENQENGNNKTNIKI
ncbi:DNA topoisomerase I [Candidatus Woesebacteria bacterium RBG_16_36_11]|uniref:DNA topoisomerase 1 n=3 Tax=Candidatus Woeseibacteriota TaxID=1752722 RepID=A0A1F7XBP4_9BACT|nr:MAG: DNA topoisomerase I [Candidatus Woesebacteria bacterium RBG_13_36_22]OGM12454.1 MAG: DNA topoisomerase I [Candidatus Woesebacteria bacterium RBG_16_36_11]OGM15633.1 MAG: DNA topoisomerase I [Candidatus Woesebacteria bacterium RBG_19FT_COMBO_37_29]